ncbi:MAG: hypothetical protein M1833_006967 [Piccolia ochrophora]|nr:MAG: hypothetical protein M1833_006967 [Piccolia ochrophora]
MVRLATGCSLTPGLAAIGALFLSLCLLHGALAMPPRIGLAVTHAYHLRCGMEVDIFTDCEPDDLWTLLGLFSKATSLNCPPGQYPIKLVFGGGGYNPSMTDKILRQFLMQLRQKGIIPADDWFNIARDVHPGPTSTSGNAARFNGFGHALNPAFTRDNPYIGATVDAFITTWDSVKVMDLLTQQDAPIILALRPIFEYVVSWVESGQADQVQTSYNYQYSLKPRGRTKEQYQEVLNAFKRSRVAMYQGSYNFRQLREFYKKYVAADPNAAGEAIEALELAFLTSPKQYLIVDRFSMLSTAGTGEYPRAASLFTALSQPSVYAQLNSKLGLAPLLRAFTENWNLGIATFQEVQLAKTLPVAGQVAFQRLQGDAKDIASAPTQENIDRGSMDIWQQQARQFQTRFAGNNLDTRRRFNIWRGIAPNMASRVVVGDLLIPFFLDGTDNVVTRSLQRVEYQGLVGPYYTWSAAPATSTSTVWFTNFAPDADVAEDRTDRLQEEIEDLYTAALMATAPVSIRGEMPTFTQPVW